MNKLLTLNRVKNVALGLGVVAFSAGSAYASFGVTGGNSNTGSSSSNTNTWTVSDTGTYTVANNNVRTNALSTTASTGGNVFGSNTDIGNIVTGGINGTASVTTTPSVGPVINLSSLGSLSGMVDLSNDTTGANSINRSTANVTNTNTVAVSNTNAITNSVAANVNSGGNNVSNNTVVGGFMGGDANYNISVSNPASGMGLSGIIMPTGGGTATVSAGNNTTGSSSSNVNTTNLTQATAVGITNTSTVANTATVAATSGGNNFSNNTSAGNVSTGGSTVNVSISN